MNQASLKTRREFLRTSLLGGSLAWTVPSFVSGTLDALFAGEAGAAVTGLTGKDDPILVILQLAGGNDGLNTLVPHSNDHYYRARPRLALPAKNVLRINDDFGFHPALTGLKGLLDDGQLSVWQGVGYPNPNRSHFRSMEIWQTASDAQRVESLGWLGRYFDNQCPGCEADAAVGLVKETPQAFHGKMPHGVVFQNPKLFKRNSAKESDDDLPGEELYRRMNHLDDESENAGGSIAGLGANPGAGPAGAPSPLDFLERVALDAEASSARIRAIANQANRPGFPATRLGRDLELVSRLIAGGMGTRVYYLSHGGFDTHQNQAGSHERLLRDFGDAVRAFCADLKAQGNLSRVALLTFSEFGRRVAENASGGTDHGAAAPVFIAGGGLPAGLFGKAPSLDPRDLAGGDLKHTLDFRSVYATLLERHLRAPSAPILGRSFPLLTA